MCQVLPSLEMRQGGPPSRHVPSAGVCPTRKSRHLIHSRGGPVPPNGSCGAPCGHGTPAGCPAGCLTRNEVVVLCY
eukprot:gene18977-biopygen22002